MRRGRDKEKVGCADPGKKLLRATKYGFEPGQPLFPINVHLMTPPQSIENYYSFEVEESLLTCDVMFDTILSYLWSRTCHGGARRGSVLDSDGC